MADTSNPFDACTGISLKASENICGGKVCDGSTFSMLAAPDMPRIFLPPFYYYEYNDAESTGTQPLLEALGLTEWPAEVANEDCSAWLTPLINELVPMPEPGIAW